MFCQWGHPFSTYAKKFRKLYPEKWHHLNNRRTQKLWEFPFLKGHMTRKLTVLFFSLIWKIIQENCNVTYLTDICFLASFWRYFILYDMQRTNSLRHTCIMTYFKMLYNFVTITQNEWWAWDLSTTTSIVGFLLIAFSRIKDIQLLGLNHYAYVTLGSWPLHSIQNEISSKRSKKTKICQRSCSTVFNDLSHYRQKNNTVNFRVICPLNGRLLYS
jgi:hypothetical protein